MKIYFRHRIIYSSFVKIELNIKDGENLKYSLLELVFIFIDSNVIQALKAMININNVPSSSSFYETG
ncbi:MAG: hypothetical protein LBR15_06580 [Methanobrevibacter sp.]|nr:hypothetical protein [Candidatus Methanovirga australis]